MAGDEVVVYGAPWCPDCKRSKKFLAEHRVAYRWVDIDQDSEALSYVEQAQNGGRTIPMIELPGGGRLLEPGNDELARALGLRLATEQPSYDLVVVGGGPTGLTAAIYAAREGIETLVVDKAGLGGQAGVTERIDNYPGFPDGVGGAELADRFIAQARRYGVELVAAVEATTIRWFAYGDRQDLSVDLGTGQSVGASAVLLAPGSSYRRLGVPGEDDLIGAGVHFCATCDGPFYKGAQELLVVGGGNAALEEGLFLTQFAQHVRVVARGSLTAARLLRDKVIRHPRMTVHLNSTVESFAGSGGRLTEVVVRTPEGERRWQPAGAFIFSALIPIPPGCVARSISTSGASSGRTGCSRHPRRVYSRRAMRVRGRPSSSARRSVMVSPPCSRSAPTCSSATTCGGWISTPEHAVLCSVGGYHGRPRGRWRDVLVATTPET